MPTPPSLQTININLKALTLETPIKNRQNQEDFIEIENPPKAPTTLKERLKRLPCCNYRA